MGRGGPEVVISVDPEAGIVTVRTGAGRVVEREVRKPSQKKNPPGTIRSLLPEFQSAFASYGGVLGTGDDFWVTLEVDAPYTPERAVNLLRRHGNSADEVAEAAFDEMLALSGKTGVFGQEICEELMDIFAERVRELYGETTEVRPQKSR